MPLHYVRRLTVVSLLVYTNTYGSDMYYNTPFPHNVFSIVIFVSFFILCRHLRTLFSALIAYFHNLLRFRSGCTTSFLFIFIYPLFPEVSEVAVQRVFYLRIISGSECPYSWRSVARCIWSSELPVCRNQLRGNGWYSWVRMQVVLQFPFALMIQVQCIGVSSFGIAFHFWNPFVCRKERRSDFVS